MNSNFRNRNPRLKNRRRVKNNNVERMYIAPLLKKVDNSSTIVTLAIDAPLQGGAIGLNGQLVPFNFAQFGDSETIPTMYKYFEILGYRLSFSLAQTVAALDSFNGATIAFYPVNNLLDSTFSAAPSSPIQVDKLEGSIFVQSTYKNVGKWFPNICKQVYPTTALSGSVLAGYIIAYIDDIGTLNEIVGQVKVEMNIKAYGRRYTPLQV